MKNIILYGVLFCLLMVHQGCSGKFWGGALTGAGTGTAATGGGYELNARKQMERIQKDRDAGRINDEEYRIRKDQIERMSVFY